MPSPTGVDLPEGTSPARVGETGEGEPTAVDGGGLALLLCGRSVRVRRAPDHAGARSALRQLRDRGRTFGDTNYRRDAEGEAWKASEGGIPFRWPAGSFRQFWGKGAAARLVGTEEVDGVSLRVVAFVHPDLPAWFRISVGVDDGLVRREVMLAEGHLMEHRYRDFNAPSDLRAPL